MTNNDDESRWGLRKLHDGGDDYVESRWGLGKLFDEKRPHNALWRLFNEKPTPKAAPVPLLVSGDRKHRHEMRFTPRPGR